jgi:hypothetical protein
MTKTYNERYNSHLELVVRAAITKELSVDEAAAALITVLDCAEYCVAPVPFPLTRNMVATRRLTAWRRLPGLLDRLSLDCTIKILVFLAQFAAGDKVMPESE